MDRLILITGAGKGLGYAVTKKHLECGDHVYALEYQISDALTELERQYGSLTLKKCDLGKTGEVKESLKELAASGKRLDILYNIAGIHFHEDVVSLEETDIDRCMLLYNINALSPLRVMKYALPCLGDGTVVLNVTSEAGSIADCQRTGEYGYCMSKAACNMASRIFSNQLAQKGIRVFCYHPGWMKTDMGGEGAMLSPTAITAEEAADAVMEITAHPQQIPPSVMYLDHTKTPLNW